METLCPMVQSSGAEATRDELTLGGIRSQRSKFTGAQTLLIYFSVLFFSPRPRPHPHAPIGVALDQLSLQEQTIHCEIDRFDL
jgi:hypothetical protein